MAKPFLLSILSMCLLLGACSTHTTTRTLHLGETLPAKALTRVITETSAPLFVDTHHPYYRTLRVEMHSEPSLDSWLVEHLQARWDTPIESVEVLTIGMRRVFRLLGPNKDLVLCVRVESPNLEIAGVYEGRFTGFDFLHPFEVIDAEWEQKTPRTGTEPEGSMDQKLARSADRKAWLMHHAIRKAAERLKRVNDD